MMPFLKFASPMYHRSLFPSNGSDKQFLAFLCPIRWIRFVQTRAKIYNDHYETLELKSNAAASEIKEAYYRLSKIYHPDVYQEGAGEGNSDKFKSIIAAYEILSDPPKRSLYDMERQTRPRGMSGPGQSGQPHYPGNAEYRGGPRRRPSEYADGYSSQNDEDWVNRNFGAKFHAEQNAAKSGNKKPFKRDPAFVYFWHFFWGSLVIWTSLTFAILFSDKTTFPDQTSNPTSSEEKLREYEREYERYRTRSSKVD